jgi:hypothetical protein
MRYTLFLCLFFLWGSSYLWADGNVAGEITWVEGSVKIEYPSKPQEDGKIGKSIGVNATIITGENSKAVIRLSDGTILSIAPMTKLLLESFIKSADRREGSILVFIGRIRAIVKQQVGKSKSKFDFKSRTAIAGVRGTHIALEVQEDGTTRVLLISGYAGVFNRDKMDLPEIMLSEGTYSEIKENQPPTPPANITPEMLRDIYASTSILALIKEDMKKAVEKRIDVSIDTKAIDTNLEQGLVLLLNTSQRENEMKTSFSSSLAEPLREQDIQGVVAPRDFTGSVESKRVNVNIRIDTSNY